MPAETSPTSSSEARSTESPSSSSDSSYDENAQKLGLLADVSILRAVMDDIDPLPEPAPAVDSDTVVRIHYTPSFNYVMGMYRVMRPKARAHIGAGTASGMHGAARWLLLLGFAVKQASSHYTVWKDRRDVVLSPSIMSYATRDQLAPINLATVTAVLASEEAANGDVENSSGYTGKDPSEPTPTPKSRLAELQADLDAATAVWLPGREDVFFTPPSPSCAEENEEGPAKGEKAATSPHPHSSRYSVWRSVRWELQTMRAVAESFHKNFQVWHHRRELLTRALEDLPVESKRHVLSAQDIFGSYLRDHHGVGFRDLDERELSRDVLEQRDAKNYHVWQHRSWFIHAFPFLTQRPSWSALLQYAHKTEEDASDDGSKECFVPDPEWLEGDCLTPRIPPCPLSTELEFTSQLIAQDCFNNSAWCHRYYVFSRDLIAPLVADFANESHRHEHTLTVSKVSMVAQVLCRREVDYALQWAMIEPANESSFVHALSVAQLLQSTLLRLVLWEKCARTQSEQCEAMLTAPLSTPLAAVFAERMVDPVEQLPIPSAAPHDFASDLFLEMSELLSWEEFSGTFALLWYVLVAMRSVLVPRVCELMAVFERNLKQAAAGDTEALETLYAKGSQYHIDNMHQAYAAEYRVCFTLLEQTWLLYFTEAQRAEVRKARDANWFAEHGITPASSGKGSGGSGGGGGDASSEGQPTGKAGAPPEPEGPLFVREFLKGEALALSLIKQLVYLDPIRAKYWKHEALVVMERDY